MVGRWRSRGPVATAGPCLLLAVDDDGPLVVRARRSKERGVFYNDVLYPDELLRDLGSCVFMLASAVMMPSDGGVSHNARFEPLSKVSQLE